MFQTKAQLEQMKAQIDQQKMQSEVQLKKELMAWSSNTTCSLRGIEVDGQKQKESRKEDRKDERTKMQATQQSELIDQRKNDSPPKNFESSGNDILGGGFGLGTFEPR